jgi:UrcA family protein
MTGILSSRVLQGTVASAVAALGLSLSTAQAQPYYDQYPSDAYTYSTDNGVTVYARPYRQERSYNGAPIERLSASRVVDISDLDLDSGYGRHIMRERIERAATDACRDLDTLPGYVPDVGENDVDCQRRAVNDALANGPVSRDVDYYGY